MRFVLLATFALTALTMACASAEEEDSVGFEQGLASSLQVDVARDGVHFTLHITNTAQAPLQLDFRSGQRYDFAVRTVSGEEVWRWSDDRGFTQALGTETLEPGQTLTYTASWDAAAAGGEYLAVGELTATNAPVRRQARFRIPA